MIISFKLLPDFGTMPMNFKNKSCYYIVSRMIALPYVCVTSLNLVNVNF